MTNVCQENSLKEHKKQHKRTKNYHYVLSLEQE